MDLHTSAARADVLPRRHVVQFYEDDAFLARAVADFIADGLRTGQPVLAITTPAHRRAVESRLDAGGIEVGREIERGRLAFLDARETLHLIVDGADLPNADQFRRVIGGRLDVLMAHGANGGGARAYGEMVDVLWSENRRQAALRLEELWNDLAATHAFSLLCAYSLRGFVDEAHARAFDDVCRQHTHVAPADAYADAPDDAARGREIARLQQRAQALAAELQMRRALEMALRDALAERERIDRALRDRERELSDVLEHAEEGIHQIADDGTILWANRAELEMLGYAAHEYVGRRITEFHVDAPRAEEIVACLARGEPLQNVEATLRHRDGSPRHVLISSSALVRGASTRAIRCFTRDITTRKQAEIRLQDAVRARDDFISIASHELRNPLHALHLHLVSLIEAGSRGAALSMPDVLARVQKAAAQVTRLGRLLDNLLDASRLAAGRLDLELEPTDLAEVIRTAVERSREQLKDIDLRTELPAAIGMWDRLRLDQIVTNLLSNALKYGERKPIAITIVPGPDAVCLRVEDHGIGIAPDDQPRLFRRFERAATARYPGGFGLGLFITRQVVEAMGGTITVTSALGRGSTFSISLPRAPAMPESTHHHGT